MIPVNERTRVHTLRPKSLGREILKREQRNDSVELDLEKWQKSNTH
jgi:hypothetical protein